MSGLFPRLKEDSCEGAYCVLAWIDRVEEAVAVSLFALILIVVFSQVLLRYVFGSPVFWFYELASYSYIWMSFVAGIFVTARRTHVTIDIFDRFLGEQGVRIIECIATLCVIGAALILVVGSWDWLMETARPKSPALRMPMIYVYGVVWVAFGMMILHSLINIFLIATGRTSVERSALDAPVE